MSQQRRIDPTAAVVGGGPAGLMAAERLAGAGFRVRVYDHKRSVGRKFLLAGRGGLNITHTEGIEQFVERYGEHADRMAMAIERFGPDGLRSWCEELGETTSVGSSGRVFPRSFRATPLLRAWLARLDDLGVELCTGHRWEGFDGDEHPVGLRFIGPDGDVVVSHADVVVLAMGGASWPRVGSDGGWVNPLVRAGVEVEDLQPANCGVRVAWSDTFFDRSSGEPIKNGAFTAGGVRSRGDCVVTSHGLEGGPVYAIGPAIREQLRQSGFATISVDLQPDLSQHQLRDRLTKRRPKATLATWLRQAGFTTTQVGLLREATENVLPTAAGEMAALIKSVPVRVGGLMPIERAISTAGGVSFNAVDENLMLQAKPGVFVAGEMLAWDAPTGGFLLQGCFSTGVVSAEGAASWFGRTAHRPRGFTD